MSTTISGYLYQNVSLMMLKSRFKRLRPNLFHALLHENLTEDAIALTEILQQYGTWDPEKDEKLNALETLLTETHAKDKVLVFTQFSGFTMETMKRASLYVSDFCAIRLHTSHTSGKIVNQRSFKQSPKPVNPTLSQFMFDVGFIERYGAGIRMMQRLCREYGNKEPRYEFHPLETKIIFDSPIQESTFIEIDDISEQLNER